MKQFRAFAYSLAAIIVISAFAFVGSEWHQTHTLDWNMLGQYTFLLIATIFFAVVSHHIGDQDDG